MVYFAPQNRHMNSMFGLGAKLPSVIARPLANQTGPYVNFDQS